MSYSDPEEYIEAIRKTILAIEYGTTPSTARLRELIGMGPRREAGTPPEKPTWTPDPNFHQPYDPATPAGERAAQKPCCHE